LQYVRKLKLCSHDVGSAIPNNTTPYAYFSFAPFLVQSFFISFIEYISYIMKLM